MKLPTIEKVEIGDVLEFVNGEQGTVIDVGMKHGELVAQVDWDDRLSSSEEYQTVASILKWVERGIWRIRRT